MMLVLYCGVGSLVTIAASGLTATAFPLVPGGPSSVSGCFLFFPLEPLPVPVVTSLVETAAAVAGPAAAVAWRRLLRSGVSFVRGKVSCEIVGMRQMLKLKVLSACSAGFRSRAGFLHQHKCNVRQKSDIVGAAAESAEAGTAHVRQDPCSARLGMCRHVKGVLCLVSRSKIQHFFDMSSHAQALSCCKR